MTLTSDPVNPYSGRLPPPITPQGPRPYRGGICAPVAPPSSLLGRRPRSHRALIGPTLFHHWGESCTSSLYRSYSLRVFLLLSHTTPTWIPNPHDLILPLNPNHKLDHVPSTLIWFTDSYLRLVC